MPFVDLKDCRLYFEDYLAQNGLSRAPMIFAHGFTIDHRMWMKEAAYFSQWFRVILLDSKGHGLSDAPPSGYSRAHRVEDVVRTLDALGIDRVHFIGLSMGGTTGLGVALKYPERLRSLTLVATSAAGFNVGPKIGKIDEIARTKGIEAAKKRWIESYVKWYREDQKDTRDLMEVMMREHSGAVWKDAMRGEYPKENDLERVHQIGVPTKIIIGELDLVFLPLARQLHQLIKGSELSIFERVGHMVNLEAPDRFIKELREFLMKVEKSPVAV